jgi:hypothetical protein
MRTAECQEERYLLTEDEMCVNNVFYKVGAFNQLQLQRFHLGW